VGGLVGKYAAVVTPSSTPGILIIVLLGPAPADPDRTEHHLAEASGLNRLAQFFDRLIISILFDHKQPAARGVAGRDHAVGVGKSQRHWFFYDDVFAEGSEINRVLGVQT